VSVCHVQISYISVSRASVSL